MSNFCAFFLLSCCIFYKIGLVVTSDKVYIATMKPIPVSAPKIDKIQYLFDGDPTTVYAAGVQFIPLTFVIDLGGAIPINTLELGKLGFNVDIVSFQLKLKSTF